MRQVSYTPVGPRADRTYGRLRITNCPVMGTVGAGALLGLVEFMLGARGSPFGTMYTAKTETVTIRRFTIQSSMYGPMIPSKTPEVSPKDLDFIFKKTAQVLSSWSASLAAQVQYVTEMVQSSSGPIAFLMRFGVAVSFEASRVGGS